MCAPGLEAPKQARPSCARAMIRHRAVHGIEGLIKCARVYCATGSDSALFDGGTPGGGNSGVGIGVMAVLMLLLVIVVVVVQQRPLCRISRLRVP